ncbi:patatin-like phospholipase family protein [Streptomyces sp. NPDC001985]|uniref:patatin-like phospholipase family protein n=1 Tax=Streptomyces sp. NPDC001985 TaxID=3154406 RepID=UPI00331A3BAD
MSGLPELAAAARAVAAAPGPGRAVEPAGERPAPAGRPGRVGLVLSGGGAKGAYHVGVVEYLAEAGATVDAIAGASIGALNGAVLACADDLTGGAAALAAIWDEVIALSPDEVPPAAGKLPEETTWEQLRLLPPRLAGPVVRVSTLERLVTTHIDAARLGDGTPLWVSAFPAVEETGLLGGWSWAVDVVRSRIGARCEWLHVNELPEEERHQAVLGSSALPVILPPRRVGERLYRDGGLADNTPAGALARHARCDLVIVVHLTHGVLWDAHDHPDLSIIEIRPERGLGPGGPVGGASALLDFSPGRLRGLRGQGYEDARRVLEPVRAMFEGVGGMLAARELLRESIARLPDQPPGFS